MNDHAHCIEVQGHRGARGVFPENTLPGFISAIEAGVDALEMDLHVTSDGEIVIHHDPMVQEKAIYSLKLAKIKQIDCGSSPNPKFPRQLKMPGMQIPTLDELFDTIDQLTDPHAKTIRLNLEIKRDPRYPEQTPDVPQLAQKILSKVKKRGFSHRVYYSSFDPDVLAEIRRLDSHAELGLLIDEDNLAIAQEFDPGDPMGLLIKQALSFKAKILSPKEDLLTDAQTVHHFHQLGFRVVTWTVNTPEEWAKCIALGVDGIITDYPEDLLEFLNTHHFP